MSNQIPQSTVDLIRVMNDISVENYGYDCILYLPTNLDVAEAKDMYMKPSDIEYQSTNTKVFIQWSPNNKMLRKLGLFVEDELPILAWFKNEFEVVKGSYISLDFQYIPFSIDTDKFNIVDEIIRGMGDKVALRCYKIAPRRIQS